RGERDLHPKGGAIPRARDLKPLDQSPRHLRAHIHVARHLPRLGGHRLTGRSRRTQPDVREHGARFAAGQKLREIIVKRGHELLERIGWTVHQP
ncbi:MAG: hypothetical protein ACK55I_13655, partial [bacterium]